MREQNSLAENGQKKYGWFKDGREAPNRAPHWAKVQFIWLSNPIGGKFWNHEWQKKELTDLIRSLKHNRISVDWAIAYKLLKPICRKRASESFRDTKGCNASEYQLEDKKQYGTGA